MSENHKSYCGPAITGFSGNGFEFMQDMKTSLLGFQSPS
jgi:hypothetical protein